MVNINLRTICNSDAEFLYSLMNTDSILDALNEVPSELRDWEMAIREWSVDRDEENYIITHDGAPIGWLSVNNLSSPDKMAYLKMAVILPKHQSKGIGHYAIDQVVKQLTTRNYAKIALYTDQSNQKAQACYKKCGFATIETLTQKMSNGKLVPRIKMERIL